MPTYSSRYFILYCGRLRLRRPRTTTYIYIRACMTIGIVVGGYGLWFWVPLGSVDPNGNERQPTAVVRPTPWHHESPAPYLSHCRFSTLFAQPVFCITSFVLCPHCILRILFHLVRRPSSYAVRLDRLATYSYDMCKSCCWPLTCLLLPSNHR